MREELDAFIGAAWGECSPKRKGYRNGSYTRDLVTSPGRLESITVPRDREGQFQVKRGYTTCGVTDDYPVGYQYIAFQKRLL